MTIHKGNKEVFWPFHPITVLMAIFLGLFFSGLIFILFENFSQQRAFFYALLFSVLYCVWMFRQYRIEIDEEWIVGPRWIFGWRIKIRRSEATIGKTMLIFLPTIYIQYSGGRIMLGPITYTQKSRNRIKELLTGH